MNDIMLVSLILMAQAKEKPIEQDITLIVGGFLVSGFVISYENYVKHHRTTSDLEELFEELRKTPVTETKEGQKKPPQFIHLRDAKYYVPGGNPVPHNTGVFVRVSLDSVHGFSFGKLEVGC